MTKPDAIQRETDRAMRPRSLADFTGQGPIIRNLRLAIEAAKQRGQALDHILLSGPPGLGKTTLASIVAQEMGSAIVETSAPALMKPGDLAGVLSGMLPKTVLFIDEIHSLPPDIEEYLYGAMEDYRITIHVGEGAESQPLALPLAPFTLIGATTREGQLSTPFRSRFGIRERLDLYSDADLATILKRSAGLLQMEADEPALLRIAERSRGTARFANNYLRRLRDFAQMENDGLLNEAMALKGLGYLGVDAGGLTEIDRRILITIANARRAVGLKTIAQSVSEEERTIEDTYEPWLIQRGLLLKTPNGRQLSDIGLAMARNSGATVVGERWERARDLFADPKETT